MKLPPVHDTEFPVPHTKKYAASPKPGLLYPPFQTKDIPSRRTTMDDYLKEALEIVKAQASVRVMTEDEITTLVRRLSAGLKGIADSEAGGDDSALEGGLNPRKSIKEKSIVCMECGKSFKILTRRHLAGHGLEPAAYREKWGLKKDTPLVSKGLQRERRKKMKDMKLWEKRRKVQ